MSGDIINTNMLTYSSKEKQIGLIIIPPVSVAMNSVLFGKAYFQSWQSFLFPTLITTGAVCLVYILCGMMATILQNRFPKYSQTFRRIGLGLLSYVVIMVVAVTILFYGYDYANVAGLQVKMQNYPWVLVVGGVCNLLATSLNEGAAFFEKWRKLVDEAEQLKRENLQSQLEGLKGQVNPHFLFNSLNSLSSLIGDDPDKAEKFLDEMSKVYRYLLRTNEDGLTTLEAEMQFIYSYFHLLLLRIKKM